MKYHIIIDTERCKGCDLCITICPKKVLGMEKKLNSRGTHYSKVVAGDLCIGCLQCVDICPDVAIEIEEEEN